LYTDQESTHVTTKFSWRRALAVPAALSLALGGVLLTSTAASAAVGNLVVTAPAVNSTTDSRTVTVTGTAAAGANIRVFTDASGTTELGRTVTNRQSGAFSVQLTPYAVTAPTAQSIYVTGDIGFSGFEDPVTRAFNLPIAKYITIDTPAAGPVDSRTFNVTGTATQGSTVIVSGAGRELGRQNLGNANTYSIPVTFTDADAVAQTLSVNGIVGGSGIDPVTRDITLPAVVAPAPAKTLVLDAPAQGTTTDSRTVTFTGTAPAGSTVIVNADDADGAELGRANLGNGTTFSIEVAYTEDDDVAQTVFVSGFVGGSGFDNTVTRDFELPAVVEPIVLDVPVITAPVNGEVVVGDRVTFQGTGTPGSDIGVIAVPTAELEQLEARIAAAQAAEQPSTLAQPNPQPEAVDPAERVIVGEDGTWSVTVATVPGDYTAVAISALLDEDGQPVLDANGDAIVAGPSNEVEFSVVAATAVVPAGTTPVAATPAGLAYTGSDNQGLALGLGAALTLAGAGLAFAARRRAKLASIAE